MLARQQRRRHHHGDLLARHRRDEGGAQRDLGLAEADIAADEPVHRPAGAEIVEHRVDGVLLVFRLLVGEACRELVVEAFRRHEARRVLEHAGGGDLHERAGHLADALLHARLARLPGTAAEPVELDLRLLRAVARQEFDILHRQKEPVAAGIMQFEAIVRRARRLDGLQPLEAADAVVDMDDEIARRQRRDLGQKILRPLARAAFGRTRRSPRMSCSPMTARSPASKPASKPQTATGTSLRGSASASARRAIGLRLRQAVVVEDMAEALARALRPGAEDDAAALRLERRGCGATAASKTLAFSSARSAMKLRPRRAPQSITVRPGCSGTAKGVSRASGSAPIAQSAHSCGER